MRKTKILIGIMFLICFTPIIAVAGDFDGSAPILCAVIETIECYDNGDCLGGTANDINMPQFLRISFKAKKITGTMGDGSKKTTKIKNKTRDNGKLILQGAENGRGWSMVISETTGLMTLTASDELAGFVVFGPCISD
jgi:hypothetical protein